MVIFSRIAKAVEEKETLLLGVVIDQEGLDNTVLGAKALFDRRGLVEAESRGMALATEGWRGVMEEVAQKAWEKKTPFTLWCSNTANNGQRLRFFFQPVASPEELIILGAGHVGQALAAIGKLVGFAVTVFDDRPSFASAERFPTADHIMVDVFDRVLGQIKIGSTSYIVIVTRGHRYDELCLRQILETEPAYVGMIGSRRKVEGVLASLQQEGRPREKLARVYAPIGLDIGAQEPAEIAVSIMAEIIQVRRGKAGTGKSMKE